MPRRRLKKFNPTKTKLNRFAVLVWEDGEWLLYDEFDKADDTWASAAEAVRDQGYQVSAIFQGNTFFYADKTATNTITGRGFRMSNIVNHNLAIT